MKKASFFAEIVAILGVILLSFLGQESLRAQAPSPATLERLAVYPTLIVYNGKIAGMDQNMTFYQAMAVRGDRIWMLGTNQEIQGLAGPQTQLIDLKGRTVVPGLVDAHTHTHLWGWWHFGGEVLPELEPAYAHGKDLEEVKLNLRRGIQQRIQKQGKDKWVIASIPNQRFGNELERYLLPMYRQVWPGGGHPGRINRAEIDSIAPDTPVFIVTGACAGIVNAKGREVMLKELGFDPGSRCNLVYNMVWGVILKGKTSLAADLVSREMKDFVKYGVTTTATQASNHTEVFKAWNMMDRQGKMPARLGWGHIGGFNAKDPAEFYRLLGDFLGQGSDFFWNVGVGYEAWDGETFSKCLSNIGRTAEIQEDLERGTPFSPCISDDFYLFQGHLAAAKAGLRMYMLHNSSGDKVMDRGLALAEQTIQSGSRTLEDIRKQGWNFDHNNLLRPDQIPLIKKYGFQLDFQGMFLARRLYNARNNYKPEYVSWVAPLKSVLDAGIKFNIGTDVSISQLSDDAENFLNNLSAGFPYRNSIWPHIGVWVQQVTEMAVGEFGSGQRRTEAVALGPEQRIDRISALKAATIWGAEMLLREDRLGSLEPGKLADFVVIDRDYFTVPEPDIMKLQTLMTVLGGKIAYKDPNF